MSRQVLMDEFLLRLFVPRSLPAEQGNAARRELSSRRFRARLRAAVEGALHESLALRCVQLRIKQ